MKEMRELNKAIQSEFASRSPRPGISRFSKRLNKTPAKNLEDAFDSVSEDISSISSKDSFHASSVSENSELNGNGDFRSQFSQTRDPELLDSSPISLQSGIMQSSSIISMEKVESSLVSSNRHGFHGAGDSKTSSTEAKIVIGVLRKAVNQVMNSSDTVDSQSKKLLYTLTEMVIEVLQSEPEENDRVAELLVAKTRIVCAFCFLCIIATVVMILFSGSGSRSSSGKLTPT